MIIRKVHCLSFWQTVLLIALLIQYYVTFRRNIPAIEKFRCNVIYIGNLFKNRRNLALLGASELLWKVFPSETRLSHLCYVVLNNVLRNGQ